MLLLTFLVVLFSICSGHPYYDTTSKLYYDTYRGTPISNEELKRYDKMNATFWCAIEVKQCDPNEGRRLDGSCNNLRHPTRGATHTPFYRVLPADYDKDFEPRRSLTGEPLPLARRLRTSLLSEGRVPDQVFTQLATYFFVFMASDVAALHDTVNYVTWKTYCCTEKGKTDSMCTPNYIPDDDPVHRFSSIRCLNMTRPFSFQSSGCLPNTTTPERINTATPLFDMSTMYGSLLNMSLEKGRKFEGGLLKYDEEDGKVWPPSSKPNAPNLCLLNVKPHETRCHETPDDGTNALLGINLYTIWFWRQHNRIARELSALNPCWSDEKLFYTTRDINIAIAVQMLYYELMPLFLGRHNLLNHGVISPSLGFRDPYNENVIPQMSLEYPFILRWVHTIQETNIKMYDERGYHLKNMPMVNLTLRTGYLAVDNNLDYITQGSIRQPGGKADYIVDPDLAEVGLGPHQRASDVLTNDLAKNRYFGFPPYIKYREYCTGSKINSFDDLADAIDPERLEILQDMYGAIEDIDMMAGVWVEKLIDGGFVPPTFYCLVVDQLLRSMVSDRHWYERHNRHNAFTLEQLTEIRQMTMARFMCDNGDSVTHIQRLPFLRHGYRNKMVSCDQIPQIDFRVWKDYSCYN